MIDFERIQHFLIHELHNYQPNLTVTEANTSSNQPDYPYIAINIYNPTDKLTGTVNKFPWTPIHAELLAISGNGDRNENPKAKFQVMNLADWLKHVYFLDKSKVDMNNARIIANQNVSPVPLSETYLGNFIEFKAGVDFIFSVYSPVNDNTMTGKMAHIYLGHQRINRKED